MASATASARKRQASCGLLLVRLAKASASRMGEALEATGLTPTHYAILHLLAEAGPVSQQGIGRGLRIHPSNLVGQLDELAERELIVRPRDPEDRRRYLVDLTPAGGRVLGRAEQAVAQAERELLEPLDASEAAELRSLLGRLAGHSCRPK